MPGFTLQGYQSRRAHALLCASQRINWASKAQTPDVKQFWMTSYNFWMESAKYWHDEVIAEIKRQALAKR